MLTTALGRSPIERAKSLSIAGLSILLGLSLWNLSSVLSSSTSLQRQSGEASSVAARFAAILLTYDYQHLDVQREQLGSVGSSSVVRIAIDSHDRVIAAQASSIATVTRTYVIKISTEGAEVIVATSQIVRSRFATAPIKLSALLDVSASVVGSAWLVTDFRFLASPIAVA